MLDSMATHTFDSSHLHVFVSFFSVNCSLCVCVCVHEILMNRMCVQPGQLKLPWIDWQCLYFVIYHLFILYFALCMLTEFDYSIIYYFLFLLRTFLLYSDDNITMMEDTKPRNQKRKKNMDDLFCSFWFAFIQPSNQFNGKGKINKSEGGVIVNK